jgi:hypothetical protein
VSWLEHAAIIGGEQAFPTGEEVSNRSLKMTSRHRRTLLTMHASDRAVNQARDRAHQRRDLAAAGGLARAGRTRAARWAGGGTDGNERLTSITGLVLIVLLLGIGVTILRIGQLISVHLFVGLLLIGPVALKMASTGYRFARYYTKDPVYRRKGPPELILRLTAPILVLSTVGVFISGVILMFEGRAHRDPMLLIHKVSFILWGVVFAVHVLGHLPEIIAYIPGVGGPSRARELRELRNILPGMTAPQAPTGHEAPARVRGAAGRSLALIGSLVAGLTLALVLVPDFSSWTHHLAGFGDH